MRNSLLARRLLSAGLAAGATRAAARVFPAQGHDSWNREHADGSTVSLVEGAWASAGVLAGLIAVPGKAKVGAACAVGASALAGYVDDHLEDRFPAQGKGLHGHLSALKDGHITTGTMKIALIGFGASLGTLALERRGSAPLRLMQWASQTVLVAGSANLVNLLDLRPGRAVKAGFAAGAPSLFSANSLNATCAAGALGAGLACLPEDLSGTTMLGDMGANAIGAGLGYGIAAVHSPIIRWLGVGDVVGLTLLSERVSFTEFIAATPWLNRIDMWGRARP